MPSRGLSPDVALGVENSTVMSRSKYSADPDPVIAEVYATAGARLDLLAIKVGRWVCYNEDDYTRVLTITLRALPSAWAT